MGKEIQSSGEKQERFSGDWILLRGGLAYRAEHWSSKVQTFQPKAATSRFKTDVAEKLAHLSQNEEV